MEADFSLWLLVLLDNYRISRTIPLKTATKAVQLLGNISDLLAYLH